MSTSPIIHSRPPDEHSSANRVYITPLFGFRSCQIYLLYDYPGMNMYSLSPGVWTCQPEVAPQAQDIPPSAKLSEDGLQSMMDQLWNLGIRPSQGVSSQGQDEARVEHIDDLRMVIDRILP